VVGGSNPLAPTKEIKALQATLVGPFSLAAVFPPRARAPRRVGVLLCLPELDHSEDVGMGVMPNTSLQDGRTVARYAEDSPRRERLYRGISLLALALRFTGFAGIAAQAVTV
jgi:hypothetical protein